MNLPSLCLVLAVSLSAPLPAFAAEKLILPAEPALSPDGSSLAFTWRGDIWMVPVEGGDARQLTRHPANDSQPAFSPDGAEIAFISARETGNQVFIVPIAGGSPEQLTFHTDGFGLEEWAPDGESLLVSATRDHFWRDAQRLWSISRNGRTAPKLLQDAYCESGSLSSDGSKLLYTREGYRWWRKGYRGAMASQIWMLDLETAENTKLVSPETDSRWPLWAAGAESFYYVGAEGGSANLREYSLKSGKTKAITRFEDDSVVFPCISRDGSTIVFRHLFDFYRLRPSTDDVPHRIEISDPGDPTDDPLERKTVDSATEVAFSDDGLEIAFIAGGDLWVMDTELREPQQITDTPEEEKSPHFSPDGNSIHFISDSGGQSDIWRASRKDDALYWWQETDFQLEQLTQDAAVETALTWSPDGKRLAFVKGSDLWTMKPDGKGAKRVFASWNVPEYDWSPDGKWFVYTVSDVDYNLDVWIIPSDGSADAVNISRHPDVESNPVWSADGEVIAFTGRRYDTEVDIFYVYLTEEEDQVGSRDRKLEKALETMKKAREKKKGKDQKAAKPDGEDEKMDASTEEEAADDPDEEEDADAEAEEKDEEPELPEVVIDFDRIHERLRRISVPDSAESNLFWHHEKKKLAFTARIDGKRGTYTIEIPEELEPKLLTGKTGSNARWLKEGDQIAWLSGGKPATMTSSGKETSYSFSARQLVDRSAHYRAGFDLAWRTMRDHFYDERLNNRNWDAIRRKYSDAAAAAPTDAIFTTVVELMLGELNASHMGFRGGFFSMFGRGGDGWRVQTAHLGLRFDASYAGPGLLVEDVIPDSPADEVKSRILPGEVVLTIDGRSVDPASDLTEVLNGPPARDISLTVKDAAGEQREVQLRPISYGAARRLLYGKWVADNQRKVEEASGGKLGYMHIQGMNMASFHKFETEVYAIGAGKDGIIIDVRENGGGFTADHLLTILCQPHHAITVGRGGGQGYPQDRKVYASWHKPIVVLCNQNSFSNAEIFSHAIKGLGRGKVVGVPTAGGVISTGGAMIMDLGFIRIPGRGWYVLETGEDMELNGCVPDYIIWPEPGEWPQGVDRQLDKAVEVLADEVEVWKARPRPKLRKQSER